jgi:hypothetical protein
VTGVDEAQPLIAVVKQAALICSGPNVLWVTDEDEIATSAHRFTALTKILELVSSHSLFGGAPRLKLGHALVAAGADDRSSEATSQLSRKRFGFADTPPGGKLELAKFNPA